MNKFRILLGTFILTSIIGSFIFCTDHVNPFDGTKPQISNNSTIQTFGKLDIDSSFGLHIKATGTKPFTFKWFKNGILDTNVAIDTLLFPALSFSDSGLYHCVVCNFSGYDTSIIYKLIPVDTMPKPPVIVGDSIKTFGTLAVDSSYGVYVSLSGTEQIVCKWYKNNTLIPNVTNDTFSFPKLAFADTGNYHCIATNNWGSDTSLSMKITLVPKYTVTYNGNGNTAGTVPIDTNNYISGTTVSVKNNSGLLVKAGYTFSGWNTKEDGTGITYVIDSSFSIGSANVLLYAKWTTKPIYKITYNGNDNTSGSVPLDTNNYEAGSKITTMNNSGLLAKTTYTFSGWNTKKDGTGTAYAVGSSFNIGSADILLYAKWTINPTYKIIYNGNGNTTGSVPVDTNDYESGATATVKNNNGLLAKTGYTFAGWNIKTDGTGTNYASGNDFNIGLTNAMLYAKWTTNPTYNVAYNGNGNVSGTVPVDNNNYEAGATITIKSNSGLLTKTGNTFSGWNTKEDGTGTTYASGNGFIIGSVNVLLYAKWTTNPTYKVTYDGNVSVSGTVPVDNNNYESGATVTVKSNSGLLVKTGFIFTGWNLKTDGTGITYEIDSLFHIGSSNVLLYAKWTKKPTYKITYNGNGKTSGDIPVDNNSYETGSTVIIKSNSELLAKTGFTFAGWNTKTDGTGTTYQATATLTMASANIILYAKWTGNPTFTVTYNGSGNVSGSVPIDGNNYEAGVVVTVYGNINNLAKTGFVFAGWNTVVDGSGTNYQPATTFAMGSSNITLYAKWTKVYTVAYNGNGSTGGNVPLDAGKYEAGATVTVIGNTGNLVKTGYTFVGWNTVADGSGASYQATETFTIGTTNVTLYAMWTQTYTVTFTAGSNGSITGTLIQTIIIGGDCLPVIAVPDVGYHFSRWLGDDTTEVNTLTVKNITKDMAISAKFVSYVSKVACGGIHTLILKSDNTLWATGSNEFGQLGDGTNTDLKTPVKIMNDISDVACGNYHTLILKSDNTLWATGWNSSGQLGDGTTTDIKTPVKIMNDVSDVACGSAHTLILKSDNTLWATGTNSSGQLGDGTTTNIKTPVKIMNDVSDVACGTDHTLILKGDNTLWATGRNYYGQLGNGTNTDIKIPVKIMNDVSYIACGGNHTAILKNDNSLWVTGYNGHGQLGNGTNTDTKTPVKIMNDVSNVACGGFHTLILKSDNTLWATGLNGSGQLGDCTNTDIKTPVKIMDNVSAADCGDYHTLILKSDNTLWATGWNNNGQLGDGTNTDKNAPIQITIE